MKRDDLGENEGVGMKYNGYTFYSQKLLVLIED